jgi:enoyl-CoA hydratase/carnithine racemase
VIAQVLQGWRLAGGSELATACDYVAEDAQIGYPR